MRVRPTSRIVLLDDQDRILLFKYEDSTIVDVARPGPSTFWCTPGGGLEPGETFEEAALRELWEETGIHAALLGPCLWTRERAVRFADEEILFRELYFLIRVPAGEVSLVNSLPYELDLYRDHRWWLLDELRRSDEWIAPPGLAELLAPIVAGDLPARPLAIDVR
jgi:8-oxo-dGTP pyrophosphatase MutT (NUDIX family)